MRISKAHYWIEVRVNAVPTLANKQDCCGCAACFNTCAFNAIVMEADETGFLYPVVNIDNCKSCNLCEKACPALSPLQYAKIIEEENQPHAYVAQHTNEEIRRQSTSGGAFTAIAEAIIMLGGVVFGASMDGGFVVRHTYTETIADLEKFRNSKYVQSEIGNSFRQCKAFLENGRWVCFSGTPCQIHGLKKYINSDFSKLITVDIVCHSVPSPLIFEKYMELQMEKNPAINKVVFRDKTWGYSYSTMALYNQNADTTKCIYRRGSESDLWFRSFLPGLCDRENCYNCSYQEYPRQSDITIWDCFTVADINPDFDDNKGTTSVVAWTEKGNNILIDNKNLKIYEVPVEIFTNKINREVHKKLAIDRETMYRDAHNITAKDFFNKYRPETIKIKVKKSARKLLRIVGLYNIVKKHMK